jgi:hypothetical protein
LVAYVYNHFEIEELSNIIIEERECPFKECVPGARSPESPELEL